MTPPQNRQNDDIQERPRPTYDHYYFPLAERVTILEQKHKLQTDALRNEINSMEEGLKERIRELQVTNTSLQLTAQKLELQVSALQVKSGLIATISAIIVAVGAFLLDYLRSR